MLKYIVAALAGIPAELHQYYVESNGQFVLQVEGVKSQSDIDKLSTALAKERADHKALRDRVALLGDKRIEDVLTELDRIPELEASVGTLDEEKIQTLLAAKLKSAVSPLERTLAQKEKDLADAVLAVEGYKTKEKTRAIHDAVRAAIVAQQGFQTSAVEDALMIAERVFDIEDGKVVSKDGVGVTPGIDPSVWLTEIQTKKPHWWGTSQGGGASGSGSKSANGAANPFTKDGWNLTEQGRILRENRARAEQLAKSAGTTVGGPKPTK